MATATVHLRLSFREVVRRLARLPGFLTGSRAATPESKMVQVRVGLAALEFIHRAYEQKMDGGADASGLRWLPLSPYTIQRRQKKMTPARSRKERALRDKQLWREIYRGLIAAGSTPASAAINAWRALAKRRSASSRREGGDARILFSTGKLEQSLWPSARPEQASSGPLRVPLQVFRIRKGAIEIGTRRPFALSHHEGRPNRKPPLPQRRLWPAPQEWPSEWWNALLEQLTEGVTKMALATLER